MAITVNTTTSAMADSSAFKRFSNYKSIPISAKANCPRSALLICGGKPTSEYTELKPFALFLHSSPYTVPLSADVTNRSAAREQNAFRAMARYQHTDANKPQS
jgi:hypothetical protein